MDYSLSFSLFYNFINVNWFNRRDKKGLKKIFDIAKEV